MEAAGLAVGVLATADLCLKYGKDLIALCHSFQNAETEVTELFLVLRALWFRIQRQILVLRNVDVANSLGEELQYLQMQMLGVLQSRLQDLTTKIDKLANASLFRRCVRAFGTSAAVVSSRENLELENEAYNHHRRITYAIYMKDSLKDSIKDLENWYNRWDPSWFLIARLAAPVVDLAVREQRAKENPLERRSLTILDDLRKALRAVKSKDGDSFDLLPATVVFGLSAKIKHSTISKAIRMDTNEAVLIDTIPYREFTNKANLQADVQKLARVLSKMDSSTCNVLMCTSVQEITNRDGQLRGFSVLFQPPVTQQSPKQANISRGPDRFDEQLNLRSLRDLLLDRTHAKSLTYRTRVSRNIARSIIFLHSASFVHKNIRPETIIITEAGESYLVGFQWFRAASGDTHMLGDAVQSNNLYRHPTRQGEAPEEMYSMQHDVYSLGVCLLEIGLWTSFVTCDDASTDSAVNVPELPEAISRLSPRDRKKRSYEVKRVLIVLAMSELPSRMGERFSAVVVSCLTCLDKDSALGSVDDLLEDDNGVILGVSYIQKILNEIEEIII